MKTISHKPIYGDLGRLTVSMAIKTRLMDAKTGKVVKESPWRKNLVNDQGLNAMALLTTGSLNGSPVLGMTACRVGGGTNANKIASGAITFTQAGTTLTASGGFFTSTMVGGLFKWGTGSGGTEIYITAFTSSTVVTVGTSATQATPTVGTVWQVQETALQTLLFTSSTYQTNGGDCLTTITNATAVHQRTFTFPVQASPYTVNEIGWNTSTAGTAVLGRIVLPSSDVVGTSNFYVVVLALTVNYTPATPTAVSNIGVNWDTSGNAAIEYMSLSIVVAASGATGFSPNTSLDGCLDGGLLSGTSTGAWLIARIGATYTQNANPGAAISWGVQNTNYLSVDPVTTRAWANVGGSLGRMRLTFTGNISTTGQTCYGIGFSPNRGNNTTLRNQPVFDIKFTTPQALPNGTWQPSIIFDLVYARALVN